MSVHFVLLSRVIGLSAVSVAICFAQASSTVSLSNGVQVRISAEPAPEGLKAELQPASGNSFYRIYRDENNLAVFAYELEVERTSDGTQFRVTALPAGEEFAVRFPNADLGKPVPTLSAPRQSPVLNPGEKFDVEIPTNPGLHENIADMVQVELHTRGAPVATGTQRVAQLRFAQLRVEVDGRMVSTGAGGAMVEGRYVMFFAPGYGGYFFSTELVSGLAFAQIGIVDGSKLRFTLENHQYECEAEQPILPKSERGQIWVYHDANYKPAGNWTKSAIEDRRDQFFTAAADSVNWWLR